MDRFRDLQEILAIEFVDAENGTGTFVSSTQLKNCSTRITSYKDKLLKTIETDCEFPMTR